MMICQAAAVVFAAVLGLVIARHPEPGGSFDSEGWVEGVVIGLVLLAPAAGLMLWGVRTWFGTLAAGLGLVVVWAEGIAGIAGDSSSTAGAGLLGLPVLAAVPVVVVIAVEHWAVRRPLPPSPPADDLR